MYTRKNNNNARIKKSLVFLPIILSMTLTTNVLADSAIRYTREYTRQTAKVGVGARQITLKDILRIESLLRDNYHRIKDIKMGEVLELKLNNNQRITEQYTDTFCYYVEYLLTAMTGYMYKVSYNKSPNYDQTTTLDTITIAHSDMEVDCSKEYNIDENLNTLTYIIEKSADDAKSKKTFEIDNVKQIQTTSGTKSIEWYRVWTIGRILSDYCSYNYSAAGFEAPKEGPNTKIEINYDGVDDELAWSAYSVLKDRTTVCAGVASFTVMCCDRLNIPCIVVYGKNNNNSDSYHAWNSVYIDGQWYMVDFTKVLGVGNLENSDALSTEDEFKLNGYMWSDFDTEMAKTIKYHELY